MPSHDPVGHYNIRHGPCKLIRSGQPACSRILNSSTAPELSRCGPHKKPTAATQGPPTCRRPTVLNILHIIRKHALAAVRRLSTALGGSPLATSPPPKGRKASVALIIEYVGGPAHIVTVPLKRHFLPKSYLQSCLPFKQPSPLSSLPNWSFVWVPTSHAKKEGKEMPFMQN